MIWLKKTFEKNAQWKADQELVIQIKMTLADSGGNPAKILMALIDDDGLAKTVYVSLPSAEFATGLEGYEVVAAPSGKFASRLVGDKVEFSRYFRLPVIEA